MKRISISLAPTFLLLSILSPPAGFGQGSAPAKSSEPDKESVICEQLVAKIEFADDGSNVSETSARMRILTPAAVRAYGLLIFPYRKANSTMELLYVRVRKPDGSVVETPVDTAQDVESEISRLAPTYSDLREKHVAVRGLAAGDVLEYSSRSRATSLAPGQLWYAYNFNDDIVTRDEQLIVKLPAEREIVVSSPRHNPVVTRAGPHKVYTWKAQKLTIEDEKKKKKDVEVVQQALLGRFPSFDVQLTSFRSWEELGRWYHGLTSDRLSATPEITAKVASLVAGRKTDEEKIEAIYNFVSLQYRYIGVSFGIGRLQPHAAGEVFGYGYGDCKDKHTLLSTMLKIAGIESFPALISSRHVIDTAVASPAQFDHLITYIPRGQGALWLDTTAEVAPAGMLVPALRGKQALVVRPQGSQLLRTPPTPSFAAHDEFVGSGTLDDKGTFRGKVQWTRRSDTELSLRGALRQLPPRQWNELLQRVSYLSGFGGKVSGEEISPVEDLSTPLKITYDYEREDYAGFGRGETSPLMPRLTHPDLSEVTKLDRDLYLGPVGDIVLRSEVKLPAGSDLEAPGPVDVVEGFAEYHASYARAGDVLQGKRRLVVKQSEVPAAQLEAVKKLFTAIDEDQDRSISLHKKAATENVYAKSDVREAKEAYKRGYQLFNEGRVGDAKAAFEHAVKADPKMQGGWDALGQSQAALGQPEEAIRSMQKEIDLHPTYVTTYRNLGPMLRALGREREEEALWSKLEKALPESAEGPASLGRMYYDKKKFPEAKAALERALEKEPDNLEVARLYGLTLVRAGELESGKEALIDAVTTDPSPAALNATAFELADAGLLLDQAEAWARRSLLVQEGNTHDLRLDQLQDKDWQNVWLLGATWDTLGWIRFRQGKYVEAESLIKAAWELTQDPEVAEHLAAVYEKMNKPALAAQFRPFAQKPPRIETVADAKRRTFSRGQDSVGAQLSQLRTTKLPRFTQSDISTEVFLLFARGPEVEDVAFLNLDKNPEAATKALKAAHYNVSFPQGSTARVLRRGFLMCNRYTGCAITLVPPQRQWPMRY